MSNKRVVVANPDRVNQAMLLPATRRDSFTIADAWRGVGENYENWRYGRAVDGLRQFPKNAFSVGDTVEVYDFYDRLAARVQVQAIKMIDGEHIADEDIALLGYRDRAEWL